MIAIGWREVGDLSRLRPDRETFKAAVLHAYPDAKPGAAPVNAGVLFRSAVELREGDLVIYPSKHDRMINLGRVVGRIAIRLTARWWMESRSRTSVR